MGVGRVELDDQPPAWIVARGARRIVELDGLDVRGVDGSNAFRDREYEVIFVGTNHPRFPELWDFSEPVSIRLNAGAVLQNLSSNEVTLSGYLSH